MVPFLQRNLSRRLQGPAPRQVNQNIQVPELLYCGLDTLLDLIRFSDITNDPWDGVLGQVADNKGGTGQERLSDMARRSSASSMAMTPSTAMHTVAAPMSCRFCLGLS